MDGVVLMAGIKFGESRITNKTGETKVRTTQEEDREFVKKKSSSSSNIPIQQAQPKKDPIKLGGGVKTESFDNLKKVGFKDWIKQNIKAHPILAATTATLAITAAATTALALSGFTFGTSAVAGTSGSGSISQTIYKHVLVRGPNGSQSFRGAGAITLQRGFTHLPGKNAALIDKIISLGFKTNSATQAATTGLISKSTGMGLAGAAFIVSSIGTYPFAKFELAEAMDKIGIAMFKASQDGEWETVQELAQLQQEMSDPSMLDKILHLIPFVNVYDAAAKNAAAAVKSAKIFTFLAEQEQIAQETGEDETAKWARIEQERDDKKEADRIADEKYYAKIAEDAAAAKAAAREEEAAYWKSVLADRSAQEEADRLAEEAYWADVRITNDKLKAANAPSALNFGLL